MSYKGLNDKKVAILSTMILTAIREAIRYST